MSHPSADVIVIGGGISGTAAACNLARRGVKVLLLERDELAGMASGWTLAGVRQSGRHPAELPLAKAAVERWERLHDELGADVEYRQNGNLRLALIEEEISSIEQVVNEATTAGIATHLLDPVAIRALAPAITPDLAAASFCPTDGHANPILTVHAFADAARHHGAEIRTGVHVMALIADGDRVTGVETSQGPIHAGTVIVAAGIYTSRLLAPLLAPIGFSLPISVTMVAAIQSIPLPPLLSQVIGVASGHVAGRQEVSGRFRMTGTSIPWNEDGFHSPESTRPVFGQVNDTIERAIRAVPALAQARLANTWGGLIDQSPDAIPVIDRPAAVEGLVVAAGFSGHGFCLGPITGEILADLATSGTTRHPIDAFKIDRFPAQATGLDTVQLHG
jgi:sarcosine oxidase subunit beta